jgi:hypothetical protein
LGFDKEKYDAAGEELSTKKKELKKMKAEGDIWTRGKKIKQAKKELKNLKKDSAYYIAKQEEIKAAE